MSGKSRKNKGFSLVEALVASGILSGTVMVVTAASMMCLRTVRLNRQYETAADLIDKQLCLIDFMGIDEFIDAGTMEGDVIEFEPGYHWQVETEYQEIDSLYLVTITVSWLDRNRPLSLKAETMFNGQTLYTETEEETEMTGESEPGDTGDSR